MSGYPPPPGLLLVLHELEAPPPRAGRHVAELAARVATAMVMAELGDTLTLGVAPGHDPAAWPVGCPLPELPWVAWWRPELSGVVAPDPGTKRTPVAKLPGGVVMLPGGKTAGMVATLVGYLDPLSTTPPAWAGWLLEPDKVRP